MNGAEFHQYLVGLVGQAYDSTHARPRGATAARRHDTRRGYFIAAAVERTSQAAQTFVCEVEAARLGLPTDDQAAAMEAHESDLRRLEGKHASDCAVFQEGFGELVVCDCRPDYTAGDAPICPGCKKEIDPDCCGCGDSIEGHGSPMDVGHSPIPMGCDCHRSKPDERLLRLTRGE